MPDALEDRRKVVELIETMICADGVVTDALLLASAASLGIEACALEERIAQRLKSVSA